MCTPGHACALIKWLFAPQAADVEGRMDRQCRHLLPDSTLLFPIDQSVPNCRLSGGSVLPFIAGFWLPHLKPFSSDLMG